MKYEKLILLFMYPLFFCHILMKFEFFGLIFAHYSHIKFHESPSSTSQVIPCGQTETQES